MDYWFARKEVQKQTCAFLDGTTFKSNWKNTAYREMQQFERTQARSETYYELCLTEKQIDIQKKAPWEDRQACELEKHREQLCQTYKFNHQISRMIPNIPPRSSRRDKEEKLITNHMSFSTAIMSVSFGSRQLKPTKKYCHYKACKK